MAPGQEIAIRALGTALAGLSLATAIHMLAYGGGKTRVSSAESVAVAARIGRQTVEASPVKPPATPTAAGAPVIDVAKAGLLPAAAGKPALRSQPVEIVAARTDRVWPRIDGAIRRAAPGDSANLGGRQAALAGARSAP
jgi:hypothetical protein